MPIAKLFFAIACAVLLSDQLSKLWAHNTLSNDIIELLPCLNLRLAYNPGAAFSWLSDAGGWQRWFFSGLSFVVSIAIGLWLLQIAKQPVLPRQDRLTGLGLSLVLGGAVGNLVDRLWLGKVIDFIDVYYPTDSSCIWLFSRGIQGCHYPTFNIADSAICVGAGLLLLSMFYASKPDAE